MIRKFCLSVLTAGLLVLPACRPGKILLTPIPERMDSLEGYATLRVTGEEGSARSKFAFLLVPPQHGRIEVSNFLAGTVSEMIFTGGRAFFVIPSRRIYWEGEEEGALDRILGFPLSLEEVTWMISGRWPDPSPAEWALSMDRSGRVLSGHRDELAFTVESFAESSPLPHRVSFSFPLSRGSLTILRIGFNSKPPAAAFSLVFRDRFQRKTWDEILENIHDSD